MGRAGPGLITKIPVPEIKHASYLSQFEWSVALVLGPSCVEIHVVIGGKDSVLKCGTVDAREWQMLVGGCKCNLSVDGNLDQKIRTDSGSIEKCVV